MSEPRASALDSATGWTIVGFGLAVLLLVWGMIFTFTVYRGELGAAFGLSSIQTSSVFSITTAAFFVAGGLAGVVIARTPLRPVVAIGGVAIGAAVGLLQVVSSYLGLAVAFAVLGVAGGTLFVIVISLVPQWFDEREGLAMGVTVIGNGLGVLVLPFVWVWLLDRTGIRTALAVVGGATAVVVLLSSIVSRRPPGLRGGSAAAVDRAWLKSTFTDRRFQAAIVGFPLVWSWYFMLSSSLVDVLTTAGIEQSVAATAFGIVGGVSVLARVGSGTLADLIDGRLTFAAGVTLGGLGVLSLTVVDSPVLMYAAMVVFGIGLGTLAALFSPIVVGAFGEEHATAAVGLFNVSEASTAFLTPIMVNALADATGGYGVPLVILSAMTLLGAALFYWGTGEPAARTEATQGETV